MDNGVYGGAVDFEYLVLGAGPAGLQLGHHLSQAGRSYMILEAGDGPGTFFKRFPRHRTLISSNKVCTGTDDPEINLCWDWNSLLTNDGKLCFKDYSRKYFPPADRLVEYLTDYAECYNLNLRCNTRVERIESLETGKSGYRLIDQKGNAFTCLHLIVAAGVTKPYVPAIPGIGLAESYVDVSVDPSHFINQKVLIVGKGNSAFETADNLIETAAVLHVCSPNPVQLAWKTHFVGHLYAVLDASIESIRRDRSGKLVAALRHTHARGEVEEIAYDRIILCTGFRYDNTIFAEDCRPELTLDGRFPDLTCEWESVNVPGVYFAGTLTQSRDDEKETSAFIHGFRYNVRALHRMLEAKHHGEPLPSRMVQATAEGLMKATLERVNRTSALWQQLGFLHDAILLESDGKSARYYEELPLAYIHETSLSASSHYYTLTLVADKAPESVFLHPVIRRWNGPLLVSEYHLPEDPDGEWRKTDAHLVPLRDFFAVQLREAVRVRA